MCLFLCQYHTVLITIVQFEVNPVLFFFKIVLAIQGLLRFHTNVRIICSIPLKCTIGF